MQVKEIEDWYHTTLNVADDMYRRGLLDEFEADFIKELFESNDVIKEFSQLGRRFLIKTDSVETIR